jgi:hypothetical protein
MENMVKKPMRVVIYPKDKKPGQFITFQEFSVFTGIDEETVLEYLMDS